MRHPYDDGRPLGQGRCGVTQRHVEVLSHIDCEHVTIKRTGSIRRGARGQRGRPEHEWPAEQFALVMAKNVPRTRRKVRRLIRRAWPSRFGDKDDRDAVWSGLRSVNPFPRIVVVANRSAFPLRRRHLRPPSRIRSDELFARHVRSDRVPFL